VAGGGVNAGCARLGTPAGEITPGPGARGRLRTRDGRRRGPRSSAPQLVQPLPLRDYREGAAPR